MLPIFINVQVMACNLDVFERFGVPPPSPDWDWQEFLRISRALTSAADGIHGAALRMHWVAFLPLVWQAGGAVYDEDGRKCLLDSDAALEVGRYLRAQGETTRGITEAATRLYDVFAQGRAGMTEIGVYGYEELNRSGCRWVARPLPQGRHRATWMSAYGYGINRRFPHRNAAVQFLRECSAVPLGAEERERRLGIPLHRELELDGDIERTYRAALGHGRLWLSDIRPDRHTPLHLAALSLINNYMEPLLFGSEPVEQLMRHLTLQIEGMLISEEHASGH